jgi:hypothetical protein
MNRYTTSTFSKAHALLYPILDTLASLPEQNQTLFQQRWQDLISSCNKQPMQLKMTWKQMEQCLGISDFSQYRDFILQCPNNQNYVKLIAHKNALEMGIFKCLEDTSLNKNYQEGDSIPLNIHHDIDFDSQEITTVLTAKNQETNTRITDPSLKSNFSDLQICDETQPAILTLLSKILPHFHHYIEEQQEEDYARLCQDWFNQGLNANSTFSDIYRICNLTCLEDLYYLLKLSPPLKGKIISKWQQNRIKYQISETPKNPTVNYALSQPLTPVHIIASIINDASSWQVLHKVAFPILQNWSTTDGNKHMAYAWKQAINQGINIETTLMEIQEIMAIGTFQEYYYHIANNFPAIT